MLTEKTWKPELLLRLMTGFLLCIGLGGLIAPLALGKAAGETEEGKFAAMVFFSLVMHGGGLLLVARFLRAQGMTWAQGFGFRETPLAQAVAYGSAAALVFLPFAWTLGQLSARVMELIGTKPEAQQAVQMLQKTTIPMQQVYFGVIAVVLAPLVEEIYFRGLLYTSLKQAGRPRAALWGSSLFFALTHANVMSFVPLTVLAFVLVWLYEKTGNLLSCIAAHATFNLVNFVLLINQPVIEQWMKQQGIIW